MDTLISDGNPFDRLAEGPADRVRRGEPFTGFVYEAEGQPR